VGTVGAVARLAVERDVLAHLLVSVTLDGPDVVLTLRVKDPGNTAARGRLAGLLAELVDHPK